MCLYFERKHWVVMQDRKLPLTYDPITYKTPDLYSLNGDPDNQQFNNSVITKMLVILINGAAVIGNSFFGKC